MNAYGELTSAQMENRTSDYSPATATKARLWYRTDLAQAKLDTGSVVSAFLLNDQHMVMGTNGTANSNVRWNRSGAGKVQLVLGGDTTAEGSDSANLGQASYALENIATVSIPAAATSRKGQIIYDTTANVPKFCSGAAWVALLTGASQTISMGVATTTYAILSTDCYLGFSGSAFTATLPDASANAGKIYYLEKTDSSLSNIITINTTSAQTIGNGSDTSTKLATQGEALMVASDGANWRILYRNIPSVWVSAAVTANGFGTLAASSFFWRREGDSIHFRGTLSAGTLAASTASLSLISGVAVDTAKISSSGGGSITGTFASLTDSGSAQPLVSDANQNYGVMMYDGSTADKIFLSYYTQSNTFAKINGSALKVGSGFLFAFDFCFPVSNWAS